MAVVAEPGNAIAPGTIVHVVFAGPPPQLSDTVPAKPLSAARAIVYVAFLPPIDCAAGDTATLKSTTRAEVAAEVLVLKFASPL